VEGALVSSLKYIDAASSAAKIRMIVALSADTTRPADTFLSPDRMGRRMVSSKNDTEIMPVRATRKVT
jgi:hypothetical protein